MSKQSSASYAHTSPQTYMACVAWCGLGREESDSSSTFSVAIASLSFDFGSYRRRPKVKHTKRLAKYLPFKQSQECLLVGCLTSQQHASVSQGRICSDNFTCCHTEIEVVDHTFHLTQSQYTDTGPTSPRSDPITPGAWQDSHWGAIFKSLV